MTASIENHRFRIELYDIESDVMKLAREKALKYKGKQLPDPRISQISRTIGDQAFTLFKQRIRAAFPTPEYSDLISLIFDSRVRLYCYFLPTEVEALIKQSSVSKETS